MQIKEAIILAGGLGTRLRESVPDLPKCMASVAGRPFLGYVIDHFRMQGIQEFIFSLGYKSEVIEKWLKEDYDTLQYKIVIEEEPLGTGGAIQLALQKATTENILVANGDTLFKVNVPELLEVHQRSKGECTLSLKPMKSFDRYGVVELEKNGKINSFKEKKYYEEGFINGGIYLLNKEKFLQHSFSNKFSFEQDYLEKYFTTCNFFGSIQDVYFIDIGVPTDFKKAQLELARTPLALNKIDKDWTIFIDRDGVINKELPGTYVLNWDQFDFCEGVLPALEILNKKFKRIVIVSNQRGVGKELMSLDDLEAIHKEMQKEIVAAGGRIDKIYFCTEVDGTCFNRKPNPGMAIQSIKDFPNIDFEKSIMIGNKPGDMRFGRSAGMYTVFLTTTNPDQPFPHPDIDLRFASLLEFARSLES